jgi:hypothetical protein
LGEVLGLSDLAGFVAGFFLMAVVCGFDDDIFGRAALSPLLTCAFSSSAALGMANAATLTQQNAMAATTRATLRVRIFMGQFLLHFWSG